MDKHRRELIRLQEPDTPLILRTAILTYEIGELIKCIVYASRFNESRKAYLAHAKSSILDIIVQTELLCLDIGVDFDEARELGWEHLEERYKDFEKDGWDRVE